MNTRKASTRRKTTKPKALNANNAKLPFFASGYAIKGGLHPFRAGQHRLPQVCEKISSVHLVTDEEIIIQEYPPVRHRRTIRSRESLNKSKARPRGSE